MTGAKSEWPSVSRFAKKKKRDLDVAEIKKHLHEEGRRVITHEELFGSRKKVDRGWGAPDAVGWGVLGHHGSVERDTKAQVRANKFCRSQQKLVRNDQGLWIKPTLQPIPKISRHSYSNTSYKSESRSVSSINSTSSKSSTTSESSSTTSRENGDYSLNQRNVYHKTIRQPINNSQSHSRSRSRDRNKRRIKSKSRSKSSSHQRCRSRDRGIVKQISRSNNLKKSSHKKHR